MVTQETIKFLGNLSENNNKTWFDEHRDEYTAAKEDFEALVAEILSGLAETEPLFKEQKAKDSIFRIFRDVRFSKDKTPYKAHFGAFFSRGGRKSTGAGYYLHLEPGGNSFAGGGLWVPEAPLLKAVRQELDYNFNEFEKIVDDKKFSKLFGQVNGEQLKNLPPGYTSGSPAAEYLKLKSFTVSHNVKDADLVGKTLVKKVLDVFTTMRPFVDFLNRAIV